MCRVEHLNKYNTDQGQITRQHINTVIPCYFQQTSQNDKSVHGVTTLLNFFWFTCCKGSTVATIWI